MRIRAFGVLGVPLTLGGCRPAAPAEGPTVDVPATMEACAALAAAPRSDDGRPAAFHTTVRLRIELAAYRARALCFVSDDGHAVMLDEATLAGADSAIDLRTTSPVRALGARFLVGDPSRPAYRWEGISRHDLAPSNETTRAVEVRLYENTSRPRSEWPTLSWRDDQK